MVTLVGSGTIKVHGWDHRPCYGFPNGKSIYWPLTKLPLHYEPDSRKVMVTTKDVAKALAKHITCMEGASLSHCSISLLTQTVSQGMFIFTSCIALPPCFN